MIDYTNIINDPYPDVRDPVTGEWLPKSAQQIRADKQREQAYKSDSAQLSSILKSIFK